MTALSPNYWFVTQLKPQGLRLAERNLQQQGFISFCPKRIESGKSRGQTVDRTVPLFPGYLFVQFDPTQSGWTAINSTRGITRLILPDIRKPSPLPPPFMEELMARCDERGTIVTAPELAIGDTIRVLSGPFAKTVGRIEHMTDDERVHILMDLMGQTTRVSVSTGRVERL